MKMLKLLILLSMVSVLGFSANAKSQEIDLGLTQDQARILFNSLSLDSETATPESYGAGIYGIRYRRLSGNTACDKIEYDIEDLENKYNCFVGL